MEFNIYQQEMDGNDYLVETREGKSKENVLIAFILENNISKNAEWLYYAVDKKKDDEEKTYLKENGCSSWDEYYEDMYPSRPIEL